MELPETDRLQPSGGRLECAPVAPAFYMGAVMLDEIIDVRDLPVRLRGDFAVRPWPTHDLTERIVGRDYIPCMPPFPEGQGWTLEIIGDRRIGVDGVKRGINGNNLKLLNLFLLTRGWGLRVDEFLALGFADDCLGGTRRSGVFNLNRARLQEKLGSQSIVGLAEGGRAEAYSLDPAMRIVDRREFRQA